MVGRILEGFYHPGISAIVHFKGWPSVGYQATAGREVIDQGECPLSGEKEYYLGADREISWECLCAGGEGWTGMAMRFLG